jgi:hypothetical protein
MKEMKEYDSFPVSLPIGQNKSSVPIDSHNNRGNEQETKRDKQHDSGCAGLRKDGRRCKGVEDRKPTSREVESRVWVIGMWWRMREERLNKEAGTLKMEALAHECVWMALNQ